MHDSVTTKDCTGDLQSNGLFSRHVTQQDGTQDKEKERDGGRLRGRAKQAEKEEDYRNRKV